MHDGRGAHEVESRFGCRTSLFDAARFAHQDAKQRLPASPWRQFVLWLWLLLQQQLLLLMVGTPIRPN